MKISALLNAEPFVHESFNLQDDRILGELYTLNAHRQSPFTRKTNPSAPQQFDDSNDLGSSNDSGVQMTLHGNDEEISRLGRGESSRDNKHGIDESSTMKVISAAHHEEIEYPVPGNEEDIFSLRHEMEGSRRSSTVSTQDLVMVSTSGRPSIPNSFGYTEPQVSDNDSSSTETPAKSTSEQTRLAIPSRPKSQKDPTKSTLAVNRLRLRKNISEQVIERAAASPINSPTHRGQEKYAVPLEESRSPTSSTSGQEALSRARFIRASRRRRDMTDETKANRQCRTTPKKRVARGHSPSPDAGCEQNHESIWEVQSIRKAFMLSGELYYNVKWHGFRGTRAEPAQSIAADVPWMLKKYYTNQPRTVKDSHAKWYQKKGIACSRFLG